MTKRDWSKPKEENKRDWSKPKQPPMEIEKEKPFMGKGFALGLGQWAEDTFKGLASHGAEPEVDIPDFLKHEKTRNRPETNRDPSFNLEQYVDPSQKTQFNVGRYGPDIIGAGVPLAKGGAKFIAKHSNKALGEKIVKDFKKNKHLANQKYETVFNNAEKEGLTQIPVDFSPEEVKLFRESFSNKQEKILMDALENPTLKNIHELKSNFKTFVRKLTTKEASKGLDAIERKALKTAEKTVNKLDENIFKEMIKKGPSKLPTEYENVNKWYATEQGPYLDNASIRKAALNPKTKGAIEPRRLPKKLSLESSDPFKAAMGHKYPELKLNRILNNPYLLPGIGLGSYTANKLFKALMGSE